MPADPTLVAEAETESLPAVGAATADGDGLVEDELLIEDVSIAGMCGVY